LSSITPATRPDATSIGRSGRILAPAAGAPSGVSYASSDGSAAEARARRRGAAEAAKAAFAAAAFAAAAAADAHSGTEAMRARVQARASKGASILAPRAAAPARVEVSMQDFWRDSGAPALWARLSEG